MKTTYRLLMALVIVAAVASCRDRASEKRIAELESRLAKMETKSNGTVAPNPATAANAQTVPATTPDVKPEGPLPVAEFANVTHDFGSVPEGEKVIYSYAVKNTGQAPLIIQNAQPSCGCTVPDWTKTPIPIGGTGFVKAEFDTHGKSGVQNKTITVTANTWPKTTKLSFTAMVLGKPDGSAGPLKK